MKKLVLSFILVSFLTGCDSHMLDCIGYGTYRDFMLDYKHVTGINDRHELSAWIENHPESTHRSLAEFHLETLEWIGAKNTNTLAAYDAFLTKYPNGKRKNIASWHRAVVMDDLSEYERLLETDPDNRDITWRRDFLVLRNAMGTNTKHAFVKFLRDYPNSQLEDMAIFYRDNVYR